MTELKEERRLTSCWGVFVRLGPHLYQIKSRLFRANEWVIWLFVIVGPACIRGFLFSSTPILIACCISGKAHALGFKACPTLTDLFLQCQLGHGSQLTSFRHFFDDGSSSSRWVWCMCSAFDAPTSTSSFIVIDRRNWPEGKWVERLRRVHACYTKWKFLLTKRKVIVYVQSYIFFKWPIDIILQSALNWCHVTKSSIRPQSNVIKTRISDLNVAAELIASERVVYRVVEVFILRNLTGLNWTENLAGLMNFLKFFYVKYFNFIGCICSAFYSKITSLNIVINNFWN